MPAGGRPETMRRRRLLGLAAGAAGLSGCLGGLPPTSRSPTAAARDRGSVAGVSLPVPESQLHGSVSRDAIPAIVDPEFGTDWAGLELTIENPFSGNRVVRPRLADDDPVIGVARAGEARAYPLKLLNWHEVVNDRLGGPLLVTYCPLCRSGLVAVRRLDGSPARFGVSGELWRSNLVLYDGRTDSRWAQVAATAIRGPMTGTTLELVPSTIATWRGWREAHPETVVLLPPPASNTVNGRSSIRDYGRDPYARYGTDRTTGPGSTFDDDRLHPKALVIGVAHDGAAKAYPLAEVRRAGVVNDRVGGRPVVVALAPGDGLVAFDRRLDGSVLTFDRTADGRLRAGGSRFALPCGEAVDGPLAGASLEPAAPIPPLFWFSWLDFHPDSALYRAP